MEPLVHKRHEREAPLGYVVAPSAQTLWPSGEPAPPSPGRTRRTGGLARRLSDSRRSVRNEWIADHFKHREVHYELPKASRRTLRTTKTALTYTTSYRNSPRHVPGPPPAANRSADNADDAVADGALEGVGRGLPHQLLDARRYLASESAQVCASARYMDVSGTVSYSAGAVGSNALQGARRVQRGGDRHRARVVVCSTQNKLRNDAQ